MRRTSEKNVHEILLALNYEFSQFSITDFVQHIASHLERIIRITPWDLSGQLFGAWISNGDQQEEYIFYDRQLPLLQRHQVILHELGHILSGHTTKELSTRELNGMLAAKLLKADEKDIFHSAQLRAHQGGWEDAEAEAFAHIVQAAIRSSEPSKTIAARSKQLNDYLDSMGLNW